MKYYKYLLGVIFFNESYKYNDISIGILCCIAVGNHHSQSTVVFYQKKIKLSFSKTCLIHLSCSFMPSFHDYNWNLNLAFSKKNQVHLFRIRQLYKASSLMHSYYYYNIIFESQSSGAVCRYYVVSNRQAHTFMYAR